MAVVIPDASYPYAYDITARQADTYTQQFTFTGQNFTGYTLSFRVLDLYDKRTILSITPTLSGTNVVTVTRTATQMDVRAGRYRYVFEATDGSSVNVEYLKGVFSILDDVNASVEDTLNDVVDDGTLGESDFVIGETPSGAINGSNATYTSANDFIPETLEVFLNGIRQTVLGDYNTSGNTTILFVTSPGTGEVLRINYIKA